MQEKYEAALNCLKKYGQEHLLNNYNNLSEENKMKLLDQILTIDFAQINDLYESTKKEISFANDKIEPINYVDKVNPITGTNELNHTLVMFSNIIEYTTTTI